MLEATRHQREAKRKGMLTQWDIFDAYETQFKDFLEEAYDETYLKTLRDDFLGYTHRSVREMLEELERHCLSLTTNEKMEKLKATVPDWNQDDDTDVFFGSLDECEDQLAKLKIEWPISHKITHAVTEVTNSGIFSEDDIMDWEDKPEVDKTWVHCQTYWNKIHKKRKRFTKTKPKQLGFEGAANIEEQPPDDMQREELNQHLRDIAEAATADKEHIQQMSSTTDELLFIVKKQQSQIDKLVETNSTLSASIAKLSAKGNTNSNNNNNSGSNNNRNRNKGNENEKKAEQQAEGDGKGHGCAVCGKHKYTKDCFELLSNKDKRPEGWKSIFE